MEDEKVRVAVAKLQSEVQSVKEIVSDIREDVKESTSVIYNHLQSLVLKHESGSYRISRLEEKDTKREKLIGMVLVALLGLIGKVIFELFHI